MKYHRQPQFKKCRPKSRLAVWCLSTLTLVNLWWSTLAFAFDVPPAWLDSLKESGTVRVLVVLNVPFQPEGRLAEADATQRAEIAQAQQALLESLQPSGNAETRFETIPVLVLAATEATLTQLQESPFVLDVQLDAPDETMAGQTVADQLKELERVYESSHSYAEVTEVTVSPASAQAGDVRELMVANLQSVGIATVVRGEENVSGREVRAANPGTCTHWNLNSDYLNSPNQKNPNPDSCGNQDVWHIMQGTTSNHDPKTYSLMTKITTSASRSPFYDSTFFHYAGEEYPSQGGFPFFGRTSHQYSTCSATRYIPADTIVGHPAHVRPLIIGWQSPVTGIIYVGGQATSLGGGTTVWYVDKGATNLAYGWTANGSSQSFQSGTNGGNLAYVKVQQGDFIYLGIDPHDDYYCDTTALDISINLVPKVTLTLTKTGNGQVASSDATLNCGTTCKSDYAQNSTVTLTATPTTGSTFTQWSGACSGTSATTTVTLDQAKTCTATFAKVIPKYTLTVSKTGTGTGDITGTGLTCGTDCTEDYVAKTLVTLTATPATGSKFVSWGGNCTGTTTPTTVTMNQAKSCTAHFIPENVTTFTLTVAKKGTGTGTIRAQQAGQKVSLVCNATCATGSYDYPLSSVVSLTATAATGSVFKGWSCDSEFWQTGTPTLIKVTMEVAKTCTAEFQ